MTAPHGPVVLGTIVVDSGTYRVRRAVLDDLPTLVELLAADTIAAARGDDPAELEPYRRAFAAIDADPHQLLVCLDDAAGEVVGTLQLTLIPGLSRRGATRAQIESVRVAERVRGGGLGSAFIRWALDRSRADGAEVVQLTTDNRRQDAHRFYRRLGFVATHQGFKLAVR